MVIRQAVRLISDMLESITDDAEFEAKQIVSEVDGGKMPFEDISEAEFTRVCQKGGYAQNGKAVTVYPG